MSIVYLACPYTHPDPQTVDYRVDMADRVAAQLYDVGLLPYSPISHTHRAAGHMKLERRFSWDFWERPSMAFLDVCEFLCVLCLPEWERSVGVRAEIKRARETGKKIFYLRVNLDGTLTDASVLPPKDETIAVGR